MLLEKKRKGEFEPSGSNDVLSAVLETPEHSGRVRGVGSFVTPTTYFNLPKGRRIRVTKSELMARDRQRSEEMERAKEEMERSKKEMKAEIDQLKAMINSINPLIPSPLLSSKGSIHEKTEVEAKLVKSSTVKGLVLSDDEDCIALDATPPDPAIYMVLN